MAPLLTGAGWLCLGGAFVWLLLAAYQGGFLGTALWSLFLDGDSRTKRATRELFADHWHDVKGPLVLLITGVAFLLIGARG